MQYQTTSVGRTLPWTSEGAFRQPKTFAALFRASAAQHRQLDVGEQVVLQPENKSTRWQPAVVAKKGLLGSYIVEKPNGGRTLRRNRRHLRPSSAAQRPLSREDSELANGREDMDQGETPSNGDPIPPSDGDPIVTEPAPLVSGGELRTRSGRVSKPPDRLSYN